MIVSVDGSRLLFNIIAFARQEHEHCKLHPCYFGDYVLPVATPIFYAHFTEKSPVPSVEATSKQLRSQGAIPIIRLTLTV
jgi:hypothetical protein